MSDEDPIPEISEAFAEFDHYADGLTDAYVDHRLDELLGSVTGERPDDGYFDTVVHRGQEILDEAHRKADAILEKARQQAVQMLADAGHAFAADGLGSLVRDDTLRTFTYGGCRLFLEELERGLRKCGVPCTGKVGADAVTEIVRTQILRASRPLRAR